MKHFPKQYIVAIVLFVLAAMVGGGLWFWTGRQLDDSLDRKIQLETQLLAVSSRGIFPSQKNLGQLESQIAAIRGKIDPVKQSLEETAKLFEPLQGEINNKGEYSGVSSNGWKRLLGEKREELLQQAISRQVKMPDSFYLGFSRYRALNPPEAATYQLGIQLDALYQLTSILVRSRVSAIDKIDRVMLEDGGNASGGEGLQARVATGPEELYTIYPFELSFKGSPASMVRVINEIASSPYFFVIRFVDVENEKTSLPRKSEIRNRSGSSDKQQLMVPIVGRESINVTLRVDLLLWNLKSETEAKTGGTS